MLQGGGFALLLLACFAAAVYWGIAGERREALRLEARQLATAAASQWPLIAHEFEEERNARKFRADREVVALPERPGQRVQWFDAAGRLIEDQGGLALPVPLRSQAAQWRQWPGGIALWQPVLTRPLPRSAGEQSEGGSRLSGYVYVGLDDEGLRSELRRLRRGLLLGTICSTLAALLLGRRMLTKAVAPLQHQVEALQRFTADASHELRHPLTAMRTLLAAETEWMGPAAPHPLLGRIDGLAARMGALLDDLLLLAWHEQGMGMGGEGASSRWRRFDLLELLEDLLELYGPRAAARQVRLQLLPGSDPGAELPVRGQPEQLQRLFTNVLLNAIRHSPPGAAVELEVLRSGSRWKVLIRDCGPGIAPEQAALVFERFWRGAGAPPSSSTSGLGLAIARAIARGHGGEILLADGRAGACVFQVTLPIA
jgi:signal transduction histidine kinase